jgi:uncharacterized protein (TIGR02266 family)
MADDRSGRVNAPPATAGTAGGAGAGGAGGARSPGASGPNAFGRPPRSPVCVPVLCRFPSFIDFVETQSVNISREGMYLQFDAPPEVGTTIEFVISLDDGFVILKGTATVVRVVTSGERGMGLRFLEVDEASRRLINRIVEVNIDEGKSPTVPFDFSRPAPGKPALPGQTSPTGMARAAAPPPLPQPAAPPVAAAPAPSLAAKPIQFGDGKLRVVLSPVTANYFTYNPLLNIRMGGFFIPAEAEVPLGTTYKVEIVDTQDRVLIAGKGKVVARQELRIGIRLGDVDKDALGRLQGLVAKLAASK